MSYFNVTQDKLFNMAFFCLFAIFNVCFHECCCYCVTADRYISWSLHFTSGNGDLEQHSSALVLVGGWKKSPIPSCVECSINKSGPLHPDWPTAASRLIQMRSTWWVEASQCKCFLSWLEGFQQFISDWSHWGPRPALMGFPALVWTCLGKMGGFLRMQQLLKRKIWETEICNFLSNVSI